MNYTQFTKIEDYQGEQYFNLPYTIRALLYTKLTAEDRKSLELGRTTPAISGKAQAIYDEWFEEIADIGTSLE